MFLRLEYLLLKLWLLFALVSCAFAQGDQSDLSKKIAETGEVSVIVGLKLPSPGFVPEGTLTAAEIAQQRETIAVTREALLDSLAGYRFTMYASWESLPSVALEVDVTTLKALTDSPYVMTIQVDEPQFADSAETTEP